MKSVIISGRRASLGKPPTLAECLRHIRRSNDLMLGVGGGLIRWDGNARRRLVMCGHAGQRVVIRAETKRN